MEATTLNNLINKISEDILTLKDQLKTNPSMDSEEVKQFVSKGVEVYSESATIQANQGVYDKYFEKFVANKKKSLHLPEDDQDNFIKFADNIIKSNKNKWTQFELLYNIKDKGVKYVLLFGKHNAEKNTSDWVIASLETYVQMATHLYTIVECQQGEPEEIVIDLTDEDMSHRLSDKTKTELEIASKKDGVEFNECIIHTIKRDKNLNKQQIEAITTYLKIAAYEKVKSLQSDIDGF